jgi:predicted metal-dependent phosphoesterase TrpH
MFHFDLHLHTSASDGALDFHSLFSFCQKRGIRGLAVTDHNCSVPFADLSAAAAFNNLEIIPAVEIKTSCFDSLADYAGVDFARKSFTVQELLIYGLDTENSEFLEYSRRHLACRREYVQNLCRLLSGRSSNEIEGLDFAEPLILDEAEILSVDGYIGSERIISYLVDNYREKAYKPDWGRAEVKKFVTSLSMEAISGLDDPFYQMDIFEGLKLAEKWGKVVVLAHPFAASRKNFSDFYRDFLFPRLSASGLNGLECSYPEHSREQRSFLQQEANRYQFLLTGGSDFHNLRDERYLPGFCGVDEKIFRKIKNLCLSGVNLLK